MIGNSLLSPINKSVFLTMDIEEWYHLEYLKKFNRESTLKVLIKEVDPVIFDVGANIGTSLQEFKSWWPKATVHCFEPQKECWSELEHQADQYISDSVFINKVATGSTPSEGLNFYTHNIYSA